MPRFLIRPCFSNPFSCKNKRPKTRIPISHVQKITTVKNWPNRFFPASVTYVFYGRVHHLLWVRPFVLLINYSCFRITAGNRASDAFAIEKPWTPFSFMAPVKCGECHKKKFYKSYKFFRHVTTIFFNSTLFESFFNENLIYDYRKLAQEIRWNLKLMRNFHWLFLVKQKRRKVLPLPLFYILVDLRNSIRWLVFIGFHGVLIVFRVTSSSLIIVGNYCDWILMSEYVFLMPLFLYYYCCCF